MVIFFGWNGHLVAPRRVAVISVYMFQWVVMPGEPPVDNNLWVRQSDLSDPR